MARPIDRDVMLEMAKDGSYTPYCLVNYHGAEYMIWKDEDGPVYSTVCEKDHPEREYTLPRNAVYWGEDYDTVTSRVMGSSLGDYGLMCSLEG